MEQLVASVAYTLDLLVRDQWRFGDRPAGVKRALRRDVALGVRVELLGGPGGRVSTLGVEEADDQLDLERVREMGPRGQGAAKSAMSHPSAMRP